MTTSDWVLASAVFVACAVEMVEALTIVLAAGLTRGWRSTLEGAAAAIVLLAALVVVFGPALVHLVPIDALRLVVGGLLLIFGLQWLRKSILRASGYKAVHDEAEIFRHEVDALSAAPRSSGRDSVAFAVSFKGVFLEGMEVVVIVLTLGAPTHRLGLAAAAAGAALVLVVVVGLLVRHALTGVPENAMKMTVGLLLTSFGTFWGAEGAGVSWPGGDLGILALLAVYAATTIGLVTALRHGHRVGAPEAV